MSNNRTLSAKAWDCINIDGKDCQGCYRQEIVTLDGDNYTTECWIELPKCGCPECRVFCGSEVRPGHNLLLVTTGRQLDTKDPGCIRWNLRKICDHCG